MWGARSSLFLFGAIDVGLKNYLFRPGRIQESRQAFALVWTFLLYFVLDKTIYHVFMFKLRPGCRNNLSCV